MGVALPTLSRVTRSVVAVCLAAIATVVVAATNVGAVPDSGAARTLGAFGLCLLGGFSGVKLRFGHSHLGLTFCVPAMMVAAGALPPAACVLTYAAAAVVGELMARRGAIKRVFNASVVTFIGGVLIAVAQIGYPVGHVSARPTALLWLAAGGGAALALSHLLVSTVVSAAQELRFREVVARGLGTHALVHLAEIGLALLCVILEAKSPWTLAVLPAIAVLLVLVNRANFREMQERET